MKKCIAVALTVVMCINNVGVVNAAGTNSDTISSVTSNNSRENDIIAIYERPSTPTYSVTLTWGSLRYKYKDSGAVWDATNRRYKTSANGQWVPLDGDGNEDSTANMVSISNDSDRHISVEVTFNKTPEVASWDYSVTDAGQTTNYGIDCQFNVHDLSTDIWYELEVGNLATRLDTSRDAQGCYTSEGYMNITGRPQYLTSLNEMTLGTSTVTIKPYNESYRPDNYDLAYK